MIAVVQIEINKVTYHGNANDFEEIFSDVHVVVFFEIWFKPEIGCNLIEIIMPREFFQDLPRSHKSLWKSHEISRGDDSRNSR